MGVPFTLSYLALAAAVLHVAADVSYACAFTLLVALAVFYSATTLCWLILWARRKESRLGQFTVGSLLFLMLFLSVFLSFVGWVASHPREDVRSWEPGSPEGFLAVTMICTALFAVAVPFLIWATESIVWLAVLAVRNPMIRVRLARLGRRSQR